MSKVIVVVQKWIETEPDAALTMWVERCFLTEESANKWILEHNPKHPEWFDYVCPSEGTKESHSYAIDFAVLEEE